MKDKAVSDKKVYALVLLGSLILLVIFVLFASKNYKQAEKLITYTSSDKDRPKAEVPVTKSDLGTMKVSQVKQSDFTITNRGNKPLQINDVTSSCSCTVGQVIYNGKVSREYGMHDPGRDTFEIAPNTGAMVRVTYRPSVMPVYGAVEREVYVKTNDPDLPRLVLQVTADVK